MDPIERGRLAEEAARIAEQGNPAVMSAWLKRQCDRLGLAQWTLASEIAAEWDRLGIRRVPRSTIVRA